MTTLSAHCVSGRDKLALADYATRRLVLIACGTPAGHACYNPKADLRAELEGVDLDGAHTMAINGAWALLPEIKFQHMATLHRDVIPTWRAKRIQGGGAPGALVHIPWRRGIKGGLDFDCMWEGDIRNGTSSLFGLLVGLALGYRHVELVGTPMENPDGTPYCATPCVKRWELAVRDFAGRMVVHTPGLIKRLWEGVIGG